MSSTLWDIFLVIISVLVSPFIIKGILRAKTRRNKIIQLILGFTLMIIFLVVWGYTGRDPLQWSFCWVFRTAPSCKGIQWGTNNIAKSPPQLEQESAKLPNSNHSQTALRGEDKHSDPVSADPEVKSSEALNNHPLPSVTSKISTEKIQTRNSPKQSQTDFFSPNIQGRYDLLEGETIHKSGTYYNYVASTMIIEKLSSSIFGFFLAKKFVNPKEPKYGITPIGAYGFIKFHNGKFKIKMLDRNWCDFKLALQRYLFITEHFP